MSTVGLSVFIVSATCVAIYLAFDNVEDELVAWTTKLIDRKRPRSR